MAAAPGSHAAAGAALLARRRGPAAIAPFRLALLQDPDDPATLFGLARAHLAALDAPGAVTLLQRLAARAPDWPGLCETLASALRRDARYEAALALPLGEPASPSLLYERALSLLQLGRAAESLATFDALLERDPEHAAGWFWSHAPALDRAGWDEAERRLIRAIACRGANRKYQAILAAYDCLRDVAAPRPCPIAYRHIIEAAELLRPRCVGAVPLFGMPAALLRWAMAAAPANGLALEFGVRRGNSLRILAEASSKPLHGFDSFVGLPEAWVKAPAGVLSTQGQLPRLPPRVTLHPGWFADTLPAFLADHPGPLRLANIDCDIYSSTRTVLWALAERITPHSLLLFDELIGNRSWRQDEYRALTDFAAAFGRDWQVLAINLSSKQVAVRIF